MGKRYRRTILEEYEWLAMFYECAADYRGEIGDFVIRYTLENGKTPSISSIVEELLPAETLKELDLMHDSYIRLLNGEITQDEYNKTADELLG